MPHPTALAIVGGLATVFMLTSAIAAQKSRQARLARGDAAAADSRQRRGSRRRVPDARWAFGGAHRSRQAVSCREHDESAGHDRAVPAGQGRERSRSTSRSPSATSSTASSTAAPFKLSEGDDSDTAIYAAVGKTLTLEQLNEAMITVSSNFAANLLIEKLGVEKIRATVTRLGADGMQVLRGVEDQKAFDKGPEQFDDGTRAAGAVRPARTRTCRRSRSPTPR